MQTVLVYIFLGLAVVYIAYKLYKKITTKKCDDKECGCK